MKDRIRTTIVILIAVALMFLAVGTAAAKASKTFVKGTEILVKDLAPGKMTYPDKFNLHIRGAKSLFRITMDDPRLTGEDLVTINANFKLAPAPVMVAGQMWGTFRISNAGGYWQGTWTGVRDSKGFANIKGVGKGYRGYQGMQLRLTFQRLTPDPSQPEQVRGYIIEKGGK